MNAPLWKVTTTYTNMVVLMACLHAHLPYEPTKTSKLYRKRWRARLTAWFVNLPVPVAGYISSATVEPYWPEQNVVPIRRTAA